MRYTIEQLSSGVDYAAKLRSLRRFEGNVYRSQPVMINFRMGLNNARKFPPIEDLRVHVIRRDRDLDLELRFTEPQAPFGTVFRNVILNISDDRNNPIVSLRTRETVKRISNLPFSAFFMMKVQAIYEDEQDLVESAVVSKAIETGPRGLPDKPRLLQVMSISNSSALIRWSSTLPGSAGISCKLVLNDEMSKDIRSMETGFMVIDEHLEPSRVYNVTLLTVLPSIDDTEISFLDQKQFKMLPKDALVAEPVVEDILGGSIHLKWRVTLPEDPLGCLTSIDHCQTGKLCSRSMISDPTIRSTHLEVEPFVRHSFIINTTCTFPPDIVVFGVSKPLEVSAAALPGPPLGIVIKMVRGRRTVQWMAESDKRFGVVCYKVDATATSTLKRTVALRSTPTFDLASLEARSRYILRISACIDDAGQRCGMPAILETTTTTKNEVGYPSRPTVELVSQDKGRIVIRWTVPTEPQGPIDGYEYAYGKKDDSFSPSNWVSTNSGQLSARVSGLQPGLTYIFHVVAFNLDSRNRRLYSPAAFLEVEMKSANQRVPQ